MGRRLPVLDFGERLRAAGPLLRKETAVGIGAIYELYQKSLAKKRISSSTFAVTTPRSWAAEKDPNPAGRLALEPGPPGP